MGTGGLRRRGASVGGGLAGASGLGGRRPVLSDEVVEVAAEVLLVAVSGPLGCSLEQGAGEWRHLGEEGDLEVTGPFGEAEAGEAIDGAMHRAVRPDSSAQADGCGEFAELDLGGHRRMPEDRHPAQ